VATSRFRQGGLDVRVEAAFHWLATNAIWFTRFALVQSVWQWLFPSVVLQAAIHSPSRLNNIRKGGRPTPEVQMAKGCYIDNGVGRI
jgi:hypothetical protein